MKRTGRDISVFSMSAIDLFASSFGAFILIVMLLYPYYRNTGSAQQQPQLAKQATSQKRPGDALATAKVMAEVAELDRTLARLEGEFSATKSRIQKLEEAIAVADTTVPSPAVKTAPTRQRNPAGGVEFSILGIGTKAKSFVIVVDLSGSMEEYADIMVASVLEVLQPLKSENTFAIMGYHDLPGSGPEFVRFPGGNQMLSATPANLNAAASFTRSLPGRFTGGTPTNNALLQALDYSAEAIILMSDGEPTDIANPRDIIDGITRINRTQRREIHTVAIGRYTENPVLPLFLQRLAAANRGDFVGVSK